MADREKVIRWLKNCDGHAIFTGHGCEKCPYFKDGNISEEECVERLHLDALELLKEQEPILLKNQHKPYGISTNANSPWISRCPKCGKKIEGKQTRFCKYCGQAVKWYDKNC